jgi:hypothetical protein
MPINLLTYLFNENRQLYPINENVYYAADNIAPIGMKKKKKWKEREREKRENNSSPFGS